MTGVDLAALRALAEQATPGPWKTTEPGVGGPKNYVDQAADTYPRMTATPVCATNRSGFNEHAAEDAAFIAACDPQTVLALVEAVEAAQACGECMRQPIDLNYVAVVKDRWEDLERKLAPFHQEQPRHADPSGNPSADMTGTGFVFVKEQP